MPLPIPNLDDRTFDQLVTEGRSLIPRYTKTWTNHNPSDPGITLMEMLAYLTETGIYQLNQVPPASLEQFLRLIDIYREQTASGDREAIDQTLERALRSLQQVSRTVTATDFESLARAAVPETPIARTALTFYEDPARDIPSTALIIVVPDQPQTDQPTPDLDLTDQIFRYLATRSLLTTRFQVIGPQYVEVVIKALEVVRKPGSGLTTSEVEQIIREFLHPLRGGVDGRGWPFGRAVYKSELYQQLESIPRVDHVEVLELGTPSPEKLTPEGNIKILPQELVICRFDPQNPVIVRD